jgi:acetate kinase
MWLIVNSGSSSVKLAVFDEGLTEVAQARVTEIGTGGPADHSAGFALGLGELSAKGFVPKGFVAAGHRVVHGGAKLTRTSALTPEVERAIEAAVPLAPLHNPPALEGIRALRALCPDVPQFVAFDTAFHASNPEVAVSYALPLAERARGLRRYGFHGLSYAAVVRKVQKVAPVSPPERLLSFHLGNGCSICAIHQGRSVATSMGYSPLDGLTMGTRAGGVDGNAVLDLAARHGIEGAARILNREAGLLALGGQSDMRALHAAGTAEAAFAIDHFAYWAIRHAGSLIAAMGGVDAISFTGGIGENDHIIRSKILNGLAFLGAVVDAEANLKHAPVLQAPSSRVAIWIIPAEEERQIAIEMRDLAAMGEDRA